MQQSRIIGVKEQDVLGLRQNVWMNRVRYLIGHDSFVPPLAIMDALIITKVK